MKRERELDRKGGVKQTRLQTRAVTDATAGGRRERQLRGGGGGGEQGHHPPATPSPTAGSIRRKLSPLAPPQLLQDRCRTASNDKHALTGEDSPALLSFFDLTRVDLRFFLVVHHGSLEEGCKRDPAAGARGELEPFAAAAAVLDDVEDKRADG